MSTVLRRASGIIDLLGAHPDQAFHVHELAAMLQLPPTSCHRILRELLDLGWVDQAGRRKSYRIGPRAWAMTKAIAYRPALLERVREPAQNLAEYLNRAVLVAVLRGQSRQTLWVYRPDGAHDEQRQLIESDDLYTTSGGRLLLALASKGQRDAILNHKGLPTKQQWSGMITQQEFNAELQLLRRRKWEQIIKKDMITMSAAFPDFEAAQQGNTTSWVVIGSHGPLASWSHDCEQATRQTAAELSVPVPMPPTVQ